MVSYSLLDQAEEDALHKSRLLNVEEKPFKRITKRLLAPNALTTIPPKLPPTPPPDASAADEEAASHEKDLQQQLQERRKWREEALLDFAAFESSIIRIQFLLTSNVKERERYAIEKLKIQSTAQAVRDNTADLHIQLGKAQETLALRKEYDGLAGKITSNRSLRPRDEQQQNIQKLHEEIANLELESRDYTSTWVERREQFGKIIEEGRQMLRLIRDEKEEVERREGMEDQEDADDDQHKGRASGVATPAPDQNGSRSPAPGQDKAPGPQSTLHEPDSRDIRGATPLREMQSVNVTTLKEDEDMAEDGEVAGDSDDAQDASPQTERDSDKEREKMDVS